MNDPNQGVITLPDGRVLQTPSLGEPFLCALKNFDRDKYSCGTGNHLTELKTNDVGDVDDDRLGGACGDA